MHIFALNNFLGMTKKKAVLVVDPSTEEKIKNAARIIFHKKGFAATRTRDIAEQADINLALLNYYFRSKEKLFDIIMLESFQEFLQTMKAVFHNDKTTLENKINLIVENYIDLFIEQPDIPLFLLSELRRNPDELVAKIKLKELIGKSNFLHQFQLQVKEGKIAPMKPLHFIMNLMSMTIFPFVASPMLRSIGDVSQKEFNELMEERKALIPKWIKSIMKAK